MSKYTTILFDLDGTLLPMDQDVFVKTEVNISGSEDVCLVCQVELSEAMRMRSSVDKTQWSLVGSLSRAFTDVCPYDEKDEFNKETFIFEEILDQLGQMPLPPYITHRLEDKNRYQTVYAKHNGSAAAPTAGLHFTPELLEVIKAKGVKVAEVTLHVGLGTFRPVKADEITEHTMHSEFYQISSEAADTINEAKKNGKRVICVGTTSCRTIESAARDHGEIKECSGWTDIFIYPGYEFKIIDSLITNFHLPKSTLLMLISALYDREKILEAYEEAIKERYRFFSYGDAMFIE